jgi:hypothetical protein
VTSLPAEAMAGRAHRLYVFGVTFAALFLLGFVVIAITAADVRSGVTAAPSRGLSDAAAATRQSTWGEYRSARGEVSRAQDRANAAELALFQFMHERVMEPVELATARSAALAHRPAKTAEVASSPLADLEQRLADLKQQREKLLDRLTPSHPTVQALDASISDLEQRVEDVRKSTETAPPPVESNLPAAEIAEPTGDVDRPRARVASGERLTGLMIAAGRARRDFEMATEKERSKFGEFTRGVRDVALAPAPQTANGIAPPRPVLAICIVLMLATICGFGVARVARRSERAYETATEVESDLGLPILGSLAIAVGASGAPAIVSNVEPHWIRRTVAVGELILAIAIGAIVVLAVVDLPLARHLAADPLSGISEEIVKMRSLAWK